MKDTLSVGDTVMNEQVAVSPCSLSLLLFRFPSILLRIWIISGSFLDHFDTSLLNRVDLGILVFTTSLFI